MKRFLLQAILLLFVAVPVFVFAQDEEHSAEYQWGERNAIWVILAAIAIIILVVRAVLKKKKRP
jgi:NADH:ubiquinone oxidoreductase subunit 6 (subunit J)